MPLKRIEYPSWHDDARKKREAEKLTLPQLAKLYNVSASRMSPIAGPRWRAYIIAFSGSSPRESIKKISQSLSNYEFVPVDKPIPAAKKSAPKQEADVSKARQFASVKKFHEGKALVGGRIYCTSCTNSEEFFNYSGSVTPNYLGKEFTRRGWNVGVHPRADKCPDCLNRLKNGTKVKTFAALKSELKSVPEVAVVANTAADKIIEGLSEALEIAKAKTTPLIPETKKEPMFIAPVVETLVDPAPVEQPHVLAGPMSKADRRIVFAKLNDVYVDETTGYSADWDDAKVSADLGIPVEWVKEVRDADFGPELSKAMKEKAKTTIEAMIGENQRLIVLLDAKIEQSQSLDGKLKEALDAMDKAIDRAEQLAKNIQTGDDKVAELIKRFDVRVEEFKKIVADFRGSASVN